MVLECRSHNAETSVFTPAMVMFSFIPSSINIVSVAAEVLSLIYSYRLFGHDSKNTAFIDAVNTVNK